MFFGKSEEVPEQISTRHAVRHLVVFQVKLALDAIRDLALSPISIVVFVLDAVRKPPVEESLYLRLMAVGRESDRVINLFDEHGEHGHYTVDETLSTVEDRVMEEMHRRKVAASDDEGAPRL